MLIDIIILIIGLFLILIGIQNFFDAAQRQLPSSDMKSAGYILIGLFFVNIWRISMKSNISTY